MVFIISQPRSGSTLLQAVLSNNNEVETASEPWILLPYLSILKPTLINAQYNYNLASKASLDFLSKVYVDRPENSIQKLILPAYAALMKANTKYILDKTPRYYEILPQIRSVFPDAKVIILKRNPLDILKSIIKTWIPAKNFFKLKSFARDLLEAPFIIEDLSEKFTHDNNCITVRYEDIVEKPDVTIKKIYEWLGIPYSDNYLDYSNNNTFKGKYGDPTGVHHRSAPEGKKQTAEKTLDNYWDPLLKGYAHYLGAEFLKNYGGYKEDSKSTTEFKEFEFLYRLDKANYLPLRKILLYKLYKLSGVSYFLPSIPR